LLPPNSRTVAADVRRPAPIIESGPAVRLSRLVKARGKLAPDCCAQVAGWPVCGDLAAACASGAGITARTTSMTTRQAIRPQYTASGVPVPWDITAVPVAPGRAGLMTSVMPSLLLVLTGSDHWTLDDGTRHPTGFWAEELLTPLDVFDDAGVEVTIATPGGVAPTVDELSLSPDMVGGEEAAGDLRRALDARGGQLSSPVPLEDVSAAGYDGVFIPGGHGPMEDLAASAGLGSLLVAMLDDDKVVASVCHGPAALLAATRADGTWAFAGRTMAGFTNEEEAQGGLAERAPWLLEDRMREAGATLEQGPAWQPFSVVDGTVVTGQNPASSGEVAQRAVEQLGRSPRRRIEVPPSDHQAFTKTVAELADVDADVAERAIVATLTTLGERISEGEAEDLARHLPDSLAALLVQPGDARSFPADELFRRVAEREGTDVDPETAERHAAAVVAALARREGRKELHDMLLQLPRELRERLLALTEEGAARR
jgi:putative intracellular protease/amidase/uncharacterized protein (DUF2267 family)